MSKHLSRLTFRGAVVVLAIANFAGRFLESNGLFYGLCSAVFMGALFEVSRWGFVVAPGERVPPGLASFLMLPAWIGYAFGLLALWIFVTPTVDSPYAAWWGYRSPNTIGLYLWNATMAAYIAYAVMRAGQLLLRGVLLIGVEMFYGARYGGRATGDAPPSTSEISSGKSQTLLRVDYDRLHVELGRSGTAALATLTTFLVAPLLGLKYPNELQNHIGVFATLYGAIIVVQKVFFFRGSRSNRDGPSSDS